DDRLGGGPAAAVAHPAQQVAVGDAGGAEEDVLAGDQVTGGQHPVDVVTGVDRLLPLGVVDRGQAPLQFAAHAGQRGRGDDALRGAADAQQHVDPGLGPGRGDRPGHVAVGDQLDARAGLTDLVDQLRVSGPVEDAHRNVGDVPV